MTQRQPASEFRYWAFISYSHRDKSWGRWLHKALETYRVPKRLVGMPVAAGKIPSRLSPVFRDRDELPTTSDLGSAIEEALRQSWCLIVICSPESAQSRWVNEEVLAFQRLGRGDRIHCLIVDSGNDAAAPLVFPPALGPRLDTDGGRIGEPVAADARRFGDGRTSAKLKLIAGILGIGYDSLVQREHQRRHRNLFYVTCASLALVIVLAVSTLVAITSRRDAVDQRSHAESLVEFMIGDLRKKLEPDGKLATLDAVGKEALAYYASQRSGDLDAEGLARRARALHMIGEVYDLRGELDEALKVFEQAADSTKELVEREPENGQRIFDHAQSVFWVGYIAYQRGNAAVAEPAFQEYKRLAERLVAIDPRNEEWQAELGYANSNLGTLLYVQGRLDEAGEVFSSELHASRESSSRSPEDYKKQERTAQAHAWLADVRRAQGRFRDAAENRKAENEIYQDALSRNPTNNDAKEAQAINEQRIGVIELNQGRLDTAIAWFRRALDLNRELTKLDPDNTRWAEIASSTYVSLAQALLYSQDIHAAAEMADEAFGIASDLVSRDPSVLSWQFRLTDSLVAQSRVKLTTGKLDDASRLAEKSENILKELNFDSMLRRERLRATVDTERLIAEIRTERREYPLAIGAWETLDRLVSADGSSPDPEILATHVLALANLGRTEDARAGIAWLAEIGFADPGFIAQLGRLKIRLGDSSNRIGRSVATSAFASKR
ncbi:MAG TPA: TIR domain-containing protein [Dokdonella sp.]|nr:TIR domain-containing protein [Dokdonella sp.]